MADDIIDLPRERMLRRGVAAASDEELIGILVGTGVRSFSIRQIAAELVRRSGGLAGLARASPRELAQVTGVGLARATRICAAFELGRRAIEAAIDRTIIARPADVHELLSPRFAGLKQELFVVIGLDVRNQLLEVVECNRGTVNGVEVHPREIFRPLIRMAAAAGVLVHNHPSGDPTPSAEDLELTKRLRAVGEVMGIPIIDHVVIAGTRWRSLAELIGIE